MKKKKDYDHLKASRLLRSDIELFGGIKEFASLLKVSPFSVRYWIQNGVPIIPTLTETDDPTRLWVNPYFDQEGIKQFGYRPLAVYVPWFASQMGDSVKYLPRIKIMSNAGTAPKIKDARHNQLLCSGGKRK